MTNDERINAEAEIRKCARNWKGQSKSAFLLGQAVKVITHYKEAAKFASESNAELGKEIISSLNEIKELRENATSDMAKRIQELSEEITILEAEVDLLEKQLKDE